MFAVSDAWNAKFCLALICFGLLARIHLRDMAWKWAICVLFTRFTIATSSYLAFALFFAEIKIFLFNQRSFQRFEMFRNTSFFFQARSFANAVTLVWRGCSKSVTAVYRSFGRRSEETLSFLFSVKFPLSSTKRKVVPQKTCGSLFKYVMCE